MHTIALQAKCLSWLHRSPQILKNGGPIDAAFLKIGHTINAFQTSVGGGGEVFSNHKTLNIGFLMFSDILIKSSLESSASMGLTL